MDRISFVEVGSPEDPATLARKPFDRLTHKLCVFLARNIVSLAVAPSHYPATAMLKVFLTAYLPKQHAGVATAVMVKFALTACQRRSRNATFFGKAPS